MKKIVLVFVLPVLALAASACANTSPKDAPPTLDEMVRQDETMSDMQYAPIINTAIADLKTHSKLSLLNGHVAINISSGSKELDGQFAESLQKVYPNFVSTEDAVNREELYQMTVKVYREGDKVLVNSIVTNFQDTKIVERTVTITRVSAKILESVQYQTSTAAKNEFEAYLNSVFGSVGNIVQEVRILQKPWTAVHDSTFSGSAISAIDYDGDKFVAGGNYGKMAYSMDGIRWTTVHDSTFGSDWIGTIAHGNGRFVVGGGYGKMAYSADGITWTAIRDNTIGSSWIGTIAYGGGRFVAGGRWGKIAYSTDGITWTAVRDSTFGIYEIRTIAYGGGKFVAGGEGGKMAYSADGITWTAASSNTFDSGINAAAYGGGRFVMGSIFGTMVYSDLQE
jgi:hypothetical protein